MRTLRSLGFLLLFAQSAVAQDPSVMTVDGRQVEVLLMGTGADARAWNSVIAELAKHTRVLAYSRSGHGRSGTAQGDGSPAQAVRELHRLLIAVGNTSQIVIASHSYGGILARLYASTYPEQVAGLVLVDATHESQFARWEALLPGVRVADLLETGLDRLPRALRSDVEHLITIQRAQRVDGMAPLANIPLAVITALKPCAPTHSLSLLRYADPEATMAENASRSDDVPRWYTRPVFFVADINRAARFYVEMLGFEKGWHEGDGAGTVCQVNHGECEIILCEDSTRRDRGRLFIELTPEALADLRNEFVERAVPTKETWWGYDTLQVDDPDGNELFFPRPD